MEPADTSPRASNSGYEDHEDHEDRLVRLRLYVAQSTPNSVRAEANLSAVLDELYNTRTVLSLEIIDVFTQPKRAITDGVIVTPTLIALSVTKRVVLMGDLTDRVQLEGMLRELLT